MSIIESRLPVVLECDSIILADYYYLLIPSLVIL